MSVYLKRNVILPAYDGVKNRVFNHRYTPPDNPNVGLVLNKNFHDENRYVCAIDKYFIEALIEAFNPVILTTQRAYDNWSDSLEYILSPKPGWAGPFLELDDSHDTAIFVSDPHNSKEWVPGYVRENNVDHVFSYYHDPFIHHMPAWLHDRMHHCPWSVPEAFTINPSEITITGDDEIHVFGAGGSEAYAVRDWCRTFPFVGTHDNSGVQNPVMTDAEYFEWLREFDAMIAAGSLSETYQLVTPKYYEIAAAGSLLFAQHCSDLERLGFTDDNAVIFDRGDFREKALAYLENPHAYMDRRRKGCELIRERHTTETRVREIAEAMGLRRKVNAEAIA